MWAGRRGERQGADGRRGEGIIHASVGEGGGGGDDTTHPGRVKGVPDGGGPAGLGPAH